MIEIDGSYGEGGGQMLRTALALSTITKKPFRMKHIRQGREKPGLKRQHVFCVSTLTSMWNGKAVNVREGSQEIEFYPGKLKRKTHEIDMGTAGSITLLLQSLIWPAIHERTKLTFTITGGTDVAWSMPYDYFEQVFLPMLRPYAKINSQLLRRGFYPKGGGKVKISITGLNYDRPFRRIEQGHLMHMKGISVATKDLEDAQVAQRQAMSAKFGTLDILTQYVESDSTGSVITLLAMYSKNPEDISYQEPIILGADALGERGVRAEVIGERARDKLKEQMSSGAPVDEHLADNLIPLLGMYGGEIKVAKITPHTLTNIYVCEQFLSVRFDVDEASRIIRCTKR